MSLLVFDHYTATAECFPSTGWIIVRTLKQFEKLHEHLVEMIPEISDKLKKMPNMNRSLLSKSFDENKIKKTKDTLDDYLKVTSIANDTYFQSQTLFCSCSNQVHYEPRDLVKLTGPLHVSMPESRICQGKHIEDR
jgi:hypothetical protein